MIFRVKIGFALVAAMLASTPSVAQVFYLSPDLSGPPLTALDPKFDAPMPGATPKEVDAVILWNMRSALNLSALQCNMEPMLRTTENYNAMLINHKAELAAAYSAVEGYFKRTKKPLSAAMAALDKFGTSMIGKYSVVRTVLTFCDAAGRISHDAKWVPAGGLKDFAKMRLPELRNARLPYGEQQFRPYRMDLRAIRMPSFGPNCFDAKGVYDRNCMRATTAAGY